MGVKNRPQCYFDVEINRAPVGRIVFELFSDVCPKTCKNFHFLCTGEKGLGKKTRKQLCYKGSTFHRIVKEFMIQGGDFSEGNGRGGESIYGGYFEDENFVLKHDREFLLSMANRGRDTNGSQFFITTKPAPHLDGVHVVFGQVITGFDAIKEIENLKTDAASRPYADVRIIDCGEFVPKSASHVTERKKKVAISYSSHESTSSSDSSTSSKFSDSDTETEEERDRKRKRKRKMKTKHSKRRRESKSKKRKLSSSQKSHNGVGEEDEKDKDLNPKRQKLSVRPEEIPPVPENRFLLRRDVPKPDTEPKLQEPPSTISEQKPVVSKSGRKIKGRGTMRYHTPSKSRSHSESELDEETSETPPHWKEEMQRVRTYRATSLEKWTKGDKLKSESRRWSDRSASPWSRSWSHDGYYSDDRRRRKSSRYKRPKKERRKIKAKKKSKKQKHSRKQKGHKYKAKETSVPSESVRSSSFKTKSSLEQEKKSPLTASSRHSSERVWSGSSSHLSSSASTASRSYSRSKSESRSRSRSRSHSRTGTRSRTRSRTRTRSRSRTSSLSRSRSRTRSSSSSASSRSRSTSKSSSKSKHKQRSSRKHFENLNQKKLDTPRVGSKENEKIITHAATVEAVPAVPLSESPPPSRWRPGQKPWKPSYVRIQEAQAKLSETTPTLSSRDSKCSREDELSPSLRKQHRSSETRRHYNSDHESDRSSTSGYQKSSRSRGFSSRSRTRSSGSRSRSSSRSRSVTKSPYRESSYSKSSSRSYESEEGCVASSEEKYGKVKKKNLVSNKQDKEQQASCATSHISRERSTGKKYESVECSVSSSQSSSEIDSDEYERGKGKSESKRLAASNSKTELPKKNRSSKKSEGKDEHPSKGSAKDHLNMKASTANDQVQKPRKNSERSKSSERKSAAGSHSKAEKSTKKVHKRARLKSETQSETEQSRGSKVQSRSTSEEGEVVEKSDVGETEGKTTTGGLNSRSKICSAKSSASSGSEAGGNQPAGRKASASSSSSGSASESEKRRKKKVKHKLKNKKRSKSKSAKFKKKSEKKKIKKVQKAKEKFHWQPPLEFGEEEEEEAKTDGPGAFDGKPKVNPPKHQTPPKVGSHDTEPSVINCTASAKVIHPVKQNAEPQESSPVTSSHQKEVESQPKQKGDPLKTEAAVAKAPSAAEKAKDPLQSVRSSTPEKCISISLAPKGGEEASLSGAGDCKGAKGSGVKPESSVPAEKSELNKTEKNDTEPAQPADINENTTESSTRTENELTDSNKWKPLKVLPNVPAACSVVNTEVKVETTEPDNKPQGLKIEIKSKNKVKPGSLFDEVRRTARLNQRQRNQESSSEEDSLSRDSNSRSRSRSTSRGHYRSSSRDRTHSRTRSRSSSRSRSHSRSYSSSYRSRSYSRSRSRRRHSRDHSSHSSSYRSYPSHSRTYSHSRSRSLSSSRHRRSRSDSYDSYDSRSRSRSRSRSYHKSRRSSRDRSYRSYRSYSRSDRSYSHHRSHSESSRYS
ncbi:NK-tumor recognition protein isoform X2 [Hypanus sabinus]|uniref:NK-tumor recognition protein isoform X2 n=1 Tax=Hypanus sabinus TaxID=79690 RepID=UPI0028C50DA3|nr:NK-tumor recognition protein isoform X2 [Hypanus sabinus]